MVNAMADVRSMDRLLGWLGASASRRASIGGVAAGLVGLGAFGRGERARVKAGPRSGGRVKTVQLAGTESFLASPQEVWDFLTNAELSAVCFASPERLTTISPTEFEFLVSRRYGRFNPSGTITSTWLDMVTPIEDGTLGSGQQVGTGTASAGGSLEYSLKFTLAPAHGGTATEANYTAEVTFYGLLAKVSQAQLTSYVQSIAYQYVQCVHASNNWGRRGPDRA